MISSCNSFGEADQKNHKGEKPFFKELNGLSVSIDLNSSSGGDNVGQRSLRVFSRGRLKSKWRCMMQCQRCAREAEAVFRVRTDILDMLVCSACADEAQIIGIPVEAAADRNGRLPPIIRDRRGEISSLRGCLQR